MNGLRTLKFLDIRNLKLIYLELLLKKLLNMYCEMKKMKPICWVIRSVSFKTNYYGR